MKNKIIYQNTPEYYHPFFDLIETDNLMEELEKSYHSTLKLFEKITPENENYNYDTNKWSIKEVIKHIIDCEVVFGIQSFEIFKKR